MHNIRRLTKRNHACKSSKSCAVHPIFSAKKRSNSDIATRAKAGL
jgi:hypothetical protein